MKPIRTATLPGIAALLTNKQMPLSSNFLKKNLDYILLYFPKIKYFILFYFGLLLSPFFVFDLNPKTLLFFFPFKKKNWNG